MIVACPSCDTRFEIPDEKYRPGRKARCSNCGHVFALPELDSDTQPVQDGPLSPSVSSVRPEPPKEAAPESPPEKEPAPAEDAAPNDAPFADPEEDVVLPQETGKKPSRKRKLLLALVGLLGVAVLGAGASVAYSVFFAAPKVVAEAPVREGDDRLARSLGSTPAGNDEKEAARLAVVSRLDIENVRQYMVTENTKTGPMIVIEGAVVNRFETPKDLLLLEVTLYDDKGNALVVREQYCGVALTILQLRTLPKVAIEGALTNQVAILSNNTNILPGGRVPFSAVFFDLPRGAYEYEVKVVDAQDPAVRK